LEIFKHPFFEGLDFSEELGNQTAISAENQSYIRTIENEQCTRKEWQGLCFS
jgi:hypothetical protein